MARATTGRKSTIYDIAAATGTSPATVSLVLNGTWARHRIKPETAERITQAAGALGYSVNLSARGLRLSRSGLAGMILPHYRNRFFADLAEAFEAEARARDICPIVVSTQREPRIEAHVTKTLLAQRVEFLFIAGVPDPGPLNQLCRAADVACVNLDLPGDQAPSIVTDNFAGARLLTRILIARAGTRGRSLENFMYLGGVRGEYVTENRVAGFIEAMREAGVAPSGDMLACCGYPPSAARDALDRHSRAHGAPPSGIFSNSIAALEGFVDFAGLLPAGMAASLIVGCFDWDPFAAHLPFDVTMLRQDVETMVRQAFAALDQAGSPAPFVVVPPVLVPGQGGCQDGGRDRD